MSPWFSELFLASQSDARLVALARGGQDSAFAAIVRRYRGELYGAARRLDANGHGEDLVQQALLQAFAALRSGAEVRHLRGWLHQILRNVVSRQPREAWVGPDGESRGITEESAADTAERRMLTQASLAAIAALPSRQRAALVQSALEGRSRTEVALSMGVSEAAVRQLVHRARETLRASVTALTPYPLARAFVAAGHATSGPATSEIVLGAGTASAAGIGLKLGAILVSGVAAIGVVAAVPNSALPHRDRSRHGQTERPAAGGSPAIPIPVLARHPWDQTRSRSSAPALEHTAGASAHAPTVDSIASRGGHDQLSAVPSHSSSTTGEHHDGGAGTTIGRPSDGSRGGGPGPTSGSGGGDSSGPQVAVMSSSDGHGGTGDRTSTTTSGTDGGGSGTDGGAAGGIDGGSGSTGSSSGG